MLKSFAGTSLNEPVKYKVRHIANKMELLDREIKYLLNKVKIWRPKQEAATNNQTDNKDEHMAEDQEVLVDSEKEKSKKEELTSGNAEEQQQKEPVLETTDTTQDPLVIPESEEPRLNDVEEEVHQEL